MASRVAVRFVSTSFPAQLVAAPVAGPQTPALRSRQRRRLPTPLPPNNNHMGPPSFKHWCNRERVSLDLLFYAYILVCCLVAMPRYYDRMTGWELGTFAAFSAATAAALCWAVAVPASYARWREPVCAAVRVTRWGLPSCQTVLFSVINFNFWGRGAVRGNLLFALAFLCSSAVVPLFHGPLAAPLHLPWQVLALSGEVAVNVWRAPAFCSCQPLQQPQARAAIHAAHTALSFLLSPPWTIMAAPASSPNGRGAVPAKHEPTPLAECWAVVLLLQLAVDFVLPLAIHATREAAAFRAFWHRHRGQVREEWGSVLYARTLQQPQLEGWVRSLKLGVAALTFLWPLWDGLSILAGRMQPGQ